MYLNTNTLINTMKCKNILIQIRWEVFQILFIIQPIAKAIASLIMSQSSSSNSNVANQDSGKLDMGKGEYSG